MALPLKCVMATTMETRSTSMALLPWHSHNSDMAVHALMAVPWQQSHSAMIVYARPCHQRFYNIVMAIPWDFHGTSMALACDYH